MKRRNDACGRRPTQSSCSLPGQARRRLPPANPGAYRLPLRPDWGICMKWYKHDPAAFLEGVIGLTAEERGFYITIIDLLYARDAREVKDELVIKAMACDPRSWRAVKKRLVAKGKIWELADGSLMARRVEWGLSEARVASESGLRSALHRWKNNGLGHASQQCYPQPDKSLSSLWTGKKWKPREGR
jgi:uncharacterized protein YdaU (DUF1376 family)